MTGATALKSDSSGPPSRRRMSNATFDSVFNHPRKFSRRIGAPVRVASWEMNSRRRSAIDGVLRCAAIGSNGEDIQLEIHAEIFGDLKEWLRRADRRLHVDA